MLAGDTVLTVTKEGSVQLWDTRQKHSHSPVLLSLPPVSSARFIAPGIIMALHRSKQVMEVRDVSRIRLTGVDKSRGTSVKGEVVLHSLLPEVMDSFEVSNDTRFLFTGSKTGSIYIWELVTGLLLNIVQSAHYQSITSLKVSSDDQLLFSGSEDSVVCAWMLGDLVSPVDGVAPKYLQQWTGHALAITSILAIPGMGPSMVLTASFDRSICLWDGFKEDYVTKTVLPVPVVSLTLAYPLVLASAVDGKIYYQHIDSLAEQWKSFHAHKAVVQSMSVNSTESLLVSTADDGMVHFWTINFSREEVFKLDKSLKFSDWSIRYVQLLPVCEVLSKALFPGVPSFPVRLSKLPVLLDNDRELGEFVTGLSGASTSKSMLNSKSSELDWTY